MLINNLRNKGFWFLDTLKGRKIKNHLDQIAIVADSPNSKAAKNLKQNRLQDLLNFAATIPFYSDYSNFNTLEDFPVLNKSVIQDNFEKFQSDRFDEEKNHKVVTSGSTGFSFFLYQDRNKKLRNYADILYFYQQSGYTLGNPIYKLIVWHSINRKSYLEAYLQNIIQVNVSQFTENNIKQFLDDVRKNNVKDKVVLCYASVLELIAKYLEKNNIYLYNIGLASVVAISEYLSTYTKETLERHLGVPVLSRYSNEELGMLAQQTLRSPNTFKINHASYHVEILSMDSDKHVAPGELGRIVVTDLFNYAMPIIRYDTGDVASYKLDHNGVMELDHIEGRKMDVIYDTKGEIISSFITHDIFRKHFHQLKQYQLIQQGEKNYEIKLNILGELFASEAILIEKVKNAFGRDAEIEITYVDEIPLLASGKRRKVINNYI